MKAAYPTLIEDCNEVMKMKRDPKPEELALSQCLMDMIRNGEVGLEFRDPDDSRMIWNREAAMKAAGVLFDHDPNFLGELLEDAAWSEMPIRKMLRMHPDYQAKLEKWEQEEEAWNRKWGSEGEEHNRALDYDKTQAAMGR